MLLSLLMWHLRPLRSTYRKQDTAGSAAGSGHTYLRRMSDCKIANVQTSCVLLRAVLPCIEHLLVHAVRQSLHNLHNRRKIFNMFFVECQPPNMFDHNHSWSLVAHKVKTVRESGSSVEQIMEPNTFACRVESLTRGALSKHIALVRCSCNIWS